MKNSFTYVLLAAVACCHAQLPAGALPLTHTAEFNQHVKNNKGQAIVKFYAHWCSVCAATQSLFDELAQEPEFSGLTFAVVDVDQAPTVSKEYNIIGVPTFIFFENGLQKDLIVGVENIDTFAQELRDFLRKNISSGQDDADLNFAAEETFIDETDESYDDEDEEDDEADFDYQAATHPEVINNMPTHVDQALPYEKNDEVAERVTQDPAEEYFEEDVDVLVNKPLQPDAEQDDTQPSLPEDERGLLGFIRWIVTSIKNILQWCITSIKNLF